MKIVCISDTHGHTFPLPKGDILVHAGDFSSRGTLEDLQNFADWLGSNEHLYRLMVVIAGNHDKALDGNFGAAFQAEEILEKASKKIAYLRDAEMAFEGLKFYGSPWTPEFGFDWAFNKTRGSELAEVWEEIPGDTDVLITHGPPMGILDECPDYVRPNKKVHAGCADLAYHVDRVKPKLHIFGHIHEGSGIHQESKTLFVNASIMNGRYHPEHSPKIVEV